MCGDVCAHVHGRHMCMGVRVEMCVRMCMCMRMDMCMDRCIGMYIHMSIDII